MKRHAIFALIALITALSFASHAHALTCYAVTQNNHIITFDSGSPGTVTNDMTITGLLPAFSVVGIDIRTTTQTTGAANPGVGSLWGIAWNNSAFQLCVINPATGVATAIGGLLNMDDSANADAFCFGFDSSRDRFQFISVQFNYEINPNTATFVQQTSFPGFPAHSGAAFTTSSFGGSSKFYNISRQSSPRTLQTSSNISTGAVSAVSAGGMGMNVSAPLGLDIEGGLFLLANSDDTSLYSVNATSGTKSLIGAIGGSPTIRGLAILPATFPPVLSVTAKIKGPKKVTTTKSSLTIKGTATSQAGITLVQYKIGKGKFKTAKGTTSWKFNAKLKPGVNTVSVQATGGNAVKSSIAKVKITRQ